MGRALYFNQVLPFGLSNTHKYYCQFWYRKGRNQNRRNPRKVGRKGKRYGSKKDSYKWEAPAVFWLSLWAVSAVIAIVNQLFNQKVLIE